MNRFPGMPGEIPLFRRAQRLFALREPQLRVREVTLHQASGVVRPLIPDRVKDRLMEGERFLSSLRAPEREAPGRFEELREEE